MNAFPESQHTVVICGKLPGFFSGVFGVPTFSRPLITQRSAISLICASTLVALCSGCSDLRDIDNKTDVLIRDRIAKLGGGAIAPNRTFGSPDQVVRSVSLTDKEPLSNNPPAGELRFRPAEESRDVAERLSLLQTEPLDGAQEMNLDAALKLSQQSAREYLSAEEDYIVAAIRLLIERHRFSPRLFASSALDFGQIQTDGSREMTLRLLNQIGARQQLPFGGEVAARWVWDASENLRAAASGGYVQSSRLVLEGNIPLLRGAGDIAQESLIQSERDLVYAARRFETFRREFLVSVAREYFQLLQQQDGITSQLRQVESLETLENRQRAWYQAGRIREFEVNLATNTLLQSRASLANLRESYILSLDRFKIRLGLPVRSPVKIVASDLTLPSPEVALDDATEAALNYRLDLQNQRDQIDDAKRAVLNSRNALLPDLDARANLTLPTKASAREGGSVYEFDDAQYSVGMTLDLPLDREIERLQLRQSIIGLQQQQRAFDKFRDDLILEVRGKTREIDRARLNLKLADERVNINQRRKEEQDLKPDEVTTQEQVDTANDLREAERARDQAKTDLRNAVLDYLLASGQLRVRRDGTFEPLPGMIPDTDAASPQPGSPTP